jgi:hypothetical protein
MGPIPFLMCSVAVDLKSGLEVSINPERANIAPQRDSLMQGDGCQAHIPCNKMIFMEWFNLMKIDSLQ